MTKGPAAGGKGSTKLHPRPIRKPVSMARLLVSERGWGLVGGRATLARFTAACRRKADTQRAWSGAADTYNADLAKVRILTPHNGKAADHGEARQARLSGKVGHGCVAADSCKVRSEHERNLVGMTRITATRPRATFSSCAYLSPEQPAWRRHGGRNRHCGRKAGFIRGRSCGRREISCGPVRLDDAQPALFLRQNGKTGGQPA